MRMASSARVTRVMNDYARKYNILKENDKNLSGDDVREGLTAVISVKLKDAQFESQTKGRLGNTEIGTLVANLINEKLSVYLEENPPQPGLFSTRRWRRRARVRPRKRRAKWCGGNPR